MNETETKIAKFEEIYMKEDENAKITAKLIGETKTHYIANVIHATEETGEETHIDEGEYPKNVINKM